MWRVWSSVVKIAIIIVFNRINSECVTSRQTNNRTKNSTKDWRKSLFFRSSYITAYRPLRINHNHTPKRNIPCHRIQFIFVRWVWKCTAPMTHLYSQIIRSFISVEQTCQRHAKSNAKYANAIISSLQPYFVIWYREHLAFLANGSWHCISPSACHPPNDTAHWSVFCATLLYTIPPFTANSYHWHSVFV